MFQRSSNIERAEQVIHKSTESLSGGGGGGGGAYIGYKMFQRSSNIERAEQVIHKSTESMWGGGGIVRHWGWGLYRLQDVPAVQQ